MTDKVIIYSDGGARGNPGPAGIGTVIYDAGMKEMERFAKHIGTTTNNQAEYRALIAGLEIALKLGATQAVCHLDSELVVRQLQGVYKVKEPSLAVLVQDALRLSNRFTRLEFVHVPREKNKLADQLVNEALDNAGF